MARPRKRGSHAADVIGYARVSTDRQGSLPDQRDAIEAECARRGWHLIDVVSEEASGGRDDGPGLADAMARIEAGDAGTLLAVKLDRVARSTKGFADLLDRAHRRGWTLVVLDVPEADMSTAAGRLVANTLVNVAAFERERISENVRRGLAYRKAQGVQLGRPSPVSAAALDRLRELRDEGASWRVIADTLNAEGVPTGGPGRWHPTSVRRQYVERIEAAA
jgi:DNA invertase Pin-like site-specific DNA recombinase